MISFYDKLVDNLGNFDEITNLLVSFDHMLKSLHNNGLCIYDFNLKKINLYNDKFTLQSFNGLINDLGVAENMKTLNIYQLAKIGLMAYNNQIVDGKMNQEYFDFIKENLEKFNQNGNIPDDIYEYYEEIFRRLNITYMNDYLIKKQDELNGNQNSNVMRKSLSTSVGRAYSKEDNQAYINILFIPSILALVYLIGLLIYTFFIK